MTKANASTPKPTKKASKIVGSIICLIIVATAMLCLGSVLITKYALHQPPSLFGYRIVKILTDSMSPQIQAGEYIWVRHINGQDVREGDIVVHVPEYGSFKGVTMTHKCIRAPYYDEEYNRTCIQTQGVHEGATVDPPVPIENVQSLYICTIPLRGFFNFITSLWGIVILVAIPCLVAILLQIVSLARKVNAETPQEPADLPANDSQKVAQAAIDEFVEKQRILQFIAARRAAQPPHPQDVDDTPAASDKNDVAPA